MEVPWILLLVQLDSASAIEYKRKVSDPTSPQIKGET